MVEDDMIVDFVCMVGSSILFLRGSDMCNSADFMLHATLQRPTLGASDVTSLCARLHVCVLHAVDGCCTCGAAGVEVLPFLLFPGCLRAN